MAQYMMRETPDLHKDGETRHYPSLVVERLVSWEELAETACKNTTFAPAEMKGIVELLARGMAQQMQQGCSVRVEGIGLFTPALGLLEETEQMSRDPSRRTARSITVRDIHFRADKELVERTATGIRLTRSSRKPQRSSTRYTPEERAELAREYLRQHAFLRVIDYCALTGLLESSARRELQRLAATAGSGIGTSGTGSHKIYVYKED